MNMYERIYMALPPPQQKKVIYNGKRLGMYNTMVVKRLGVYNNQVKKKLGVY